MAAPFRTILYTPNGDSAMDEANDSVNVSVVSGSVNLDEVTGTDGAAGPAKALSVAGTLSSGELKEFIVDAAGVLYVRTVGNGNENTSASAYGAPVLTAGRYDVAERTLDDGDLGGFSVSRSGKIRISATNQFTGADGFTNANAGTLLTTTDVATQLAVMPSFFNGTTWDRFRGDATDGLLVNLGSNTDVTNAGTFAVQAASEGDVAHDSADSGNPVKIGGVATNSVEGRTQVADGDRTNLLADLNGVAISRPHTTLEEILSERVTNTNGTSTAFSTFAAGGAGVHNYVTTISIYNSSGTDGYVDFRDGTSGAIIFTAPAPSTGGSVINLPVPLKGAANTALAYDVSGALSTVYISVVGFQAQG